MQMEFSIKIPENAKLIIDTLYNEGFDAFVVGGCVRDSILGLKPGDWDITTQAPPFCVKEIFKKTIDTGIKHGTVTVMIKREGYEVTTYRIDGEYMDGRHPESVEFTKDLREDLLRRDFTINAMAYNDRVGLVDEFDGIGDLDKKLIKCVGNPYDRFSEDALRMMRAVRFAARLCFTIEEGTANAIKELAKTIKMVSAERIENELTKTILSDNPSHIRFFKSLGLMQYFSPMLNELSDELLLNWLKVIEYMPKDSALRYAVLLCELDGEKILKELKFDNNTINVVKLLKPFVKEDFPLDRIEIKRVLNVLDKDLTYGFLNICKAKDEAFGTDTDNTAKAEAVLEDIINSGEPYKLSMLSLTGKDLIKAGVKPGPMIGDILARALEIVIVNPSQNEAKHLLEILNI